MPTALAAGIGQKTGQPFFPLSAKADSPQKEFLWKKPLLGHL
jgi:hypothetical protein